MKCNNCINCNKYRDMFYCITSGEVMNIYTILKDLECGKFIPALDKVVDA